MVDGIRKGSNERFGSGSRSRIGVGDSDHRSGGHTGKSHQGIAPSHAGLVGLWSECGSLRCEADDDQWKRMDELHGRELEMMRLGQFMIVSLENEFVTIIAIMEIENVRG